MSGNKWWSTKDGAKSLSDLVTFSIFSCDVYQSAWVVPLKHLMYFLADITTK